MSNIEAKKVTARTDVDEANLREELTARARALLPILKKNAAETDRSRRIPQENMDAIENAGLLRILTPARLGGYQSTFRTRLDVISAIAEGCGSTAWVYYILTDMGWLVGCLPERVQHEILGKNPNTKIMGQVTPAGSARRVDGGVILNSKSYYSTGSQFADWVFASSLEVASNGEIVQPIAMLVPKKDYRIEDTWHVAGMRGTASACTIIEDAFVPDHLVFPLIEFASGNYPSEFKDEVIYRGSFVASLGLSTAPTHIGLARAALNYTLEMADKRAVPFSTYLKQTQSTSFQITVAQAALKIEGAQALAEKWLEFLDQAARSNRALSLLERARIRAICGQISRETIAAVDLLLTAHGTGSFAETNPMQRIWRDINIVARHGFVSTALGDEVLGRALIGGIRRTLPT
ncbi:acyl-CoA dehydrogenase family protein [Bradyrhizobium neotropicale]|uniref:Uncharacterized protein n=1 Tax=Bradyrhizobium neotropicale TaxID=1497615 RepID=A0A176ZES2_9BRAD|nr:acyl-CoA dehydrogenase family protein [Bradyrhizobium neotropicale]OAF19171.1 hypothetical protein AXW67_37525 [Bradyrhizobium neotropicale]